MKKVISLTVVAVMVIAGVGLSRVNAEEVYQYVDINGDLRVEVADTPMEAINTAENRHPESGVMLTSSSVLGATATTGEQVYGYIDVSGTLRTEVADTPTEAIVSAEAIHPNSGVVEMGE